VPRTNDAIVSAEDGGTIETPLRGGIEVVRCDLEVLDGELQGRRFKLPLDQTQPFRIGKAPENDLALPDASVSRQHCELLSDAGNWVVRDLGSTNGTFVDNTGVREAYLHAGSVLRVGEVQLRLASAHEPASLAASSESSFGNLFGRSLAMREIFALMQRLSSTEATVLISGETGTGKGAVARAIHSQSPRASGPFVVVDCGAVAPTLIESELFGHERGAFTGASQRRIGALEYAEGGTLFLDELEDLRADLQPKLLRALEDREFQRVGANQPIKLDARVIAATKRDARELVRQNLLREDLYFRIAVFQIEMPPLRSRLEDIQGLVGRFAEALGRTGAWEAINPAARERLSAYDWPGNIRELRNVVERACALMDGGVDAARAWELAARLPSARDVARPETHLSLGFHEAKERVIDAFEAEYLRNLLSRSGFNVARAARESGLDRKHLYVLLRKHGIDVRAAAEAKAK
jgi:DNA-binding NtrC family response regulator